MITIQLHKGLIKKKFDYRIKNQKVNVDPHISHRRSTPRKITRGPKRIPSRTPRRKESHSIICNFRAGIWIIQIVGQQSKTKPGKAINLGKPSPKSPVLISFPEIISSFVIKFVKFSHFTEINQVARYQSAYSAVAF